MAGKIARPVGSPPAMSHASGSQDTSIDIEVSLGTGSGPPATAEFSARQFLRYAWATITRPRSTFDALARERSVRWVVVVVSLSVLQVWQGAEVSADLRADLGLHQFPHRQLHRRS